MRLGCARRRSIRNSSSVISNQPRRCRGAFTIAELVVSVGVLSILLLMAGSIFTLTLKSSGDATALIEVHQLLKTLEDNMREDLANVSRTSSMMVIQGNPVNAYWTADEADVDDDGDPYTGLTAKRDPQREFVDATGAQRMERPRADILMFFTAREGTSNVDPDVKGRLQHVVYSHAEVGEWNQNGTWKSTPVQFLADEMPDPVDYDPPTAIHAVPARDWLLAKRSTLIVDQNLAPSDTPPHYPAASLDDSASALTGSDNEPAYSTFAKAGWLRDGRRDYVVNAASPVGNSTQDFSFEQYVLQMTPSPKDDVALTEPTGYPAFTGNVGALPSQLQHWIVPWFARPQMDTTPPALQVDRFGGYFAPHCASFKVEWALDLRGTDLDSEYRRLIDANGGVFWVDPADMEGTTARLQVWIDKIHNLASDPPPPPPNDPVSRLTDKLVGQDLHWHTSLRFGKDFVGTTHVFYARDPSAGDAYQPDPLFPKALRVTVDVYDAAGRLDRPIRHVMVLPVGRD